MIKYSKHGPIIGKVVRTDLTISLCSKSLEALRLPEAIYKMNTSSSVEEFSEAVDEISAPRLILHMLI